MNYLKKILPKLSNKKPKSQRWPLEKQEPKSQSVWTSTKKKFWRTTFMKIKSLRAKRYCVNAAMEIITIAETPNAKLWDIVRIVWNDRMKFIEKMPIMIISINSIAFIYCFEKEWNFIYLFKDLNENQIKRDKFDKFQKANQIFCIFLWSI